VSKPQPFTVMHLRKIDLKWNHKPPIMAIFTDHPDYKILSDLLLQQTALAYTKIMITCKPKKYKKENN